MGFPKGVRHFQYDLAAHVDGSDATSLTEGECLCHRRVYAIWTFLRTTFEAYEKSILIDVASHLGVRETRRICGENTLTEEMVMGAVKHPEGVSRCSWYMDLHDGQDRHPLEQYRPARRPPDGDYYEIPYGCLVPLGVEQILVSGRCISSTRPARLSAPAADLDEHRAGRRDRGSALRKTLVQPAIARRRRAASATRCAGDGIVAMVQDYLQFLGASPAH